LARDSVETAGVTERARAAGVLDGAVIDPLDFGRVAQGLVELDRNLRQVFPVVGLVDGPKQILDGLPVGEPGVGDDFAGLQDRRAGYLTVNDFDADPGEDFCATEAAGRVSWNSGESAVGLSCLGLAEVFPLVG
jgi:hypothetical protein